MSRRLRFVFPCTGHSGSKFVAKLITGAGVPCGHEKIYCTYTMYQDDDQLKNGTPVGTLLLNEWVHNIGKYEAESSYAAAPFLNDPLSRDAMCVHVVRRPISVVSSWYHDGGIFGFPFFDHWLRTGIGLRTPEACVTMYVLWNAFIARQRGDAQICRVEDPQRLLDLCGLSGDIPEKCNAHRDPEKQPDLLFSDIDQPQRDILLGITEAFGYGA